MGFTTVSFIFILLPITLILYEFADRFGNMRIKNAVLMASSLLFYSWCGIQYLFLIIALVLINFNGAGRIRKSRRKKAWLALTLIFNIGVLAFFKYFNFFVANIEALLQLSGLTFHLQVPNIPLPPGISFVIFQMISFLADTYNGKAKEDHFWNYVLYIMLFPQLIQGPIVRYHEMADALRSRTQSAKQLEYGTRRFIVGFAKKVMIADQLTTVSDAIFSAAYTDIPMGYAWLGALTYAFVIYFDFSGYSDMAIGLCEIFGFHISENFNYPYVSKTIQEFWRRWHISLSSWFRDYVYIPLGGNRHGTFKTYRNLIIVFLLTGFWHGASWSFIIWGIYHGIFQLLERIRLKKILMRMPVLVSHIYCTLVVLVGWVFFRAENISLALSYIKNMFVINAAGYQQIDILKLLDSKYWTIMLAAFIFSTPVGSLINKKTESGIPRIVGNIICLIIFIAALSTMLGSSFSPSIYTKF